MQNFAFQLSFASAAMITRLWDSGQASANAMREVIETIGCPGSFIDQTFAAQIIERKALVESPPLVHKFWEIAT